MSPYTSFAKPFAQAINALHLRICRRRAVASLMHRLSGEADTYDPRFQPLRTAFNPKSRWGDGTPENTHYTPLLAELFPQARFVCLVRDPAQVANSLLNMDASVAAGMTDERAYDVWEEMTQRAMEAAALLGRRQVCVVPVKELTEDPASVMQAVLAFLGLPNFAPAAAVFERRVNTSFTADKPATRSAQPSERHALIYQVLLNASPLEALPWKRRFDPSYEHANDLITRLLSIFTD